MKKLRSSSLLSQYIILYTLIVFTPVLIIFVSLLHSNKNLEKEIISSNQTSVALTQNALDNMFQGMDSTLDHLGANASFSRFSLADNPLQATESLRNVVRSNNHLTEIIVAAKGDSWLYSSEGRHNENSLKESEFLSQYLTDGRNIEGWLDALRSCEDKIYISGNGFDPDAPLYLFSPIYYEYQAHTATPVRKVALIITRQYINELFQSARTTDAENLLLLNSNMEILSALTEDDGKNTALQVANFLKKNPDIIEEGYGQLKNSNLVIFVSKSESTGLCYVRYLPKAVAFQSLDRQVVYTVAMAVLAFIIALTLIFMAIKQSYTPIRNLASWIRDRQPEDSSRPQNELTLFQEALSSAYTQNEGLVQTVNLSRQGMLDYLIGNLINGTFRSKNDFLTAFRAHDVNPDKPYYAVCSILIEEGNDLPIFAEVLKTIHSDIPDSFMVLAKDMLLERKIVLVIGSNTNDYDAYTILATDIKNQLLEHNNLLTSMGMGSFYNSFALIGKSYLDSTNALDYRMVYGKDCLITPDIYNGNTPGLSDSYPSTDLELLDSSLVSHNAEMAAAVIRRINANIKLKSYSLHMAKYICYDIFSIFRKDADFSDAGSAQTLTQTLDVTRLTGYATVDEFFSALLDMIEDRFDSSKSPETPQSANIGAQLLEYTDAQCLSYDFQAKTMAEHFNISPQYMRKLFKNHTGMSVSEYVSNKRLEKSMYLLANTDMNLQDIVVQIGNSDISGFVRFFKQKTGMTPGQYRKAKRPAE